VPVQPIIDQISALAQKLQPLDIAESEIRFLTVSQNDLDADFHDCAEQMKSEAEDEQQLNAAISSLIGELQKIQNEVPQMSNAEIEDLKSTVLPSIRHQLDVIAARDIDAHAGREYIQRQWSDDQTTVKGGQSLADSVDQLAADRSKQLEADAAQQQAIDEWLQRKCEVEQDVFGVISDSEQLLGRYADKLEPTNVQTAENDAQKMSNLADRLRQARQLLQNAIDWLLQNHELPEEQRRRAIEELTGELNRLDSEAGKLQVTFITFLITKTRKSTYNFAQ
jgi:predicted transcriptional regulator